MAPPRKSVLPYICVVTFQKVGVGIQKVGVKYSKFGVNETSVNDKDGKFHSTDMGYVAQTSL